MMEKLKDRYNLLSLFFVIAGFIIVFKLVDLQIVHGKEHYEDSQLRVLKQMVIPAPRGRILDRNGIPIAVNRQGFIVRIVNTGLKTSELNKALLKLVNILQKNHDSFNNSLSRYLTFNPVTFNKRSDSEIIKWQKDKNLFDLDDSQLMKTPGEIFKYLREKKFAINSGYTDEEAYKIMTLRYEILKNQWNFDTGYAVSLADDIRGESVAEIEERHYELTGVTTSIMPVRKYIDASILAHITGYVGLINAEQIIKYKNDGYDWNDIIGQTGVELAAEKYLRGRDGMKKVEVDTRGRQTKEIGQDPAIPGNDVILTIDLNLQRVAVESLERNMTAIRQMGGKKNFHDANAGAVVAIDVNSGEVLAMASYPSYDPAIFLEGSDNIEARKAKTALFSDKSSPMFNRTIQGKYAPGSTFKPIVAIAGLEEGVITPNTIIHDSGVVNIGGRDFYCLEYNRKTGTGAHGGLILERALASSCNIFFHILGFRTTINKIDKWATLFGLGDKTGIDIPDESKGILASIENKKKLHNDDWRPADTAQTAIGQFDNAFTPVQLANYVSTLANDGKKFTPFLIKRIIGNDGSIVKETVPSYLQVPVKIQTINAVKKGMIAVTNSEDGTAISIFRGFPYKVAGKTGTAETGFELNQSSNALFVCYAPADNPRIAVAVVVEKGVWGAYTAPIARDILDAYFNEENQNSNDGLEPEGVVFTQ